MGLDIRLPIGMLFSILGIMLIAFGLLSDPAMYVQSLGINVNFRWGIVLLIFGAIMLYLGARAMFWRRVTTENSSERESRH
jgi:membrane protein implicated in regulation of membrane protease activity